MSFTHYSSLSSAILDDWVSMFGRMNVASLTISKAVTTTIQLRNTTLQPHAREIGCLHPNSSSEVSNILSPISFPCIFRFWVDWVDTFERMNLKLQTSKLSKIESKRNVCTFSTNFRWFLMTFTLELFRRSLKSGQPNQPLVTSIFQKLTIFFICSVLKAS